MKKISIVIVTYNSEKDIYDCVSSIQRCCDIPIEELELIIVDNNSKNVTHMFEQLRKQWGESIVLISNTHNGGYGQGNNVGIRASSAPILLIMNPDVRLITPFFKKPLKRFSEDSHLSMYGMKQMYTEALPSRSSFGCTKMMNGYMSCFLEAFCNRMEWFIPQIHFFSGSCFFIRKNMFESIGLFDESIFMYGEEDDIHYRMKANYGTHFFYDKEMKYLHLVSDRVANVPYELKRLNSLILLNEKKGYSRKSTLMNVYRNYRLLYLREKIRKNRKNDFLRMYKEVMDRIQEDLTERNK